VNYQPSFIAWFVNSVPQELSIIIQLSLFELPVISVPQEQIHLISLLSFDTGVGGQNSNY